MEAENATTGRSGIVVAMGSHHQSFDRHKLLAGLQRCGIIVHA